VATVRANGVELRVNRYRVGAGGDRPVVVFVHGLGIVDHSGLAFTLGMPLATDAEAILYALRGHGHSQVMASGYRVADHVADLIALLDELGVRVPVHMVGCSYGGAVAVAAAARHPGRVASLFLLDPVLPVAGWAERVLVMLEPAATRLADDYTVEDVQLALGGVSRRKAAAVAQRAERLLVHTTILDDVRSEGPLDRREFARVRCPVTAVYGDRSEMLPLADALPLLVPRARVHLIAGADHLSVFGHTRELGDLIRRHVGLPPAADRPAGLARSAGEP
jgi:pimeloyl-ACP methyl ester carboxylesterase